MSPRLNITHSANVTIAELTDREISKFDETAAAELTAQLFALVEARPALNLLLDFSNVAYLNSSMLGILIRLKKRIKESQGRLKLCAINPKLYEMFLFTEVHTLFEICDRQPIALRQFRAETEKPQP